MILEEITFFPQKNLIEDLSEEAVQKYKYPGTILNDKLTFEPNTDVVWREALQRVFFFFKGNSTVLMSLHPF